jgi:hypothetical protein
MDIRRRRDPGAWRAGPNVPEIARVVTLSRHWRVSFRVSLRCIVDAVPRAVRGDIPWQARRNIDSAHLPSYQGSAFNLVR